MLHLGEHLLHLVAMLEGMQGRQEFGAEKRRGKPEQHVAQPRELQPIEVGVPHGPGAGWGERFSNDVAPRKIAQWKTEGARAGTASSMCYDAPVNRPGAPMGK